MASTRLKMILSREDISRLVILESASKLIRIIADVHGMSCHQARRFILNIINTVHCSFQLVVIHGYNHGTAIRDMLAVDFKNPHVSEQHQDIFNKGVTHMSIAA